MGSGSYYLTWRVMAFLVLRFSSIKWGDFNKWYLCSSSVAFCDLVIYITKPNDEIILRLQCLKYTFNLTFYFRDKNEAFIDFRWKQWLVWRCLTRYSRPSTHAWKTLSGVSDKTSPLVRCVHTFTPWSVGTGSTDEPSSFLYSTSLMTQQ